jgi:biotin carboxyl carrier protein
MKVEIVVNGRLWTVAVEPAAQARAFTVTIKGKSRVVDASWIDADTVSMIDDGTAREIRLHSRGDSGTVGVEISGKVYEAFVSRRKREREEGATGATGATGAVGVAGAIRISSPMPGRVMRVLVSVGDRVSARQGVVVVEAMKMENELRTPKDGVVKEVLVVAGAAVETGAVLVVIEDQ